MILIGRQQLINRVKSLGHLLVMLAVILLGTGPVYAQRSKLNLERERKENQQRINEAAKILEQTAQQKSATIGELNALNQQLSQRMQLVGNLNEEIGLLLQEIDDINEINGSLQEDLITMKAEYAAMVYNAAKHKANSKLMFLLAADSFFQFWSRLLYLRQFREARVIQAKQIRSVKQALMRQRKALLDKTRQRETLLGEQVRENRKLIELQSAQQQVVRKLSDREKDLKQELEDRRDRDARLDRLIADMIRREMRRAARQARDRARRETADRRRNKSNTKNTAKSSSKKGDKETSSTKPVDQAEPEEEEEDTEEETEPTTIALSAEGLSMSRNFAGNRNRLIWPVETGFIAEHYGKHEHPVIKHVMVDNLGVDIQTKSNQAVRSVFDGEIGFVAMLPGAAGKIVSVIHGDYITVYCNVKDVTVDVGQRVKASQLLGHVAADKDGVSTLQFQVWRNQNKLNPEQWLRRK